MRGEHRIRDNKRFLYEESARVPFIARGPGIPHGESSDDVVVNADLTSTILRAQRRVRPGLTQDGESLLPTLANPKLEHGRAILLEAYAGEPILGVRTSRYLYTEWDTRQAAARRRSSTTPTSTRTSSTNLANRTRPTMPVVAELGSELDELIDCAGGGLPRARPPASSRFTDGWTARAAARSPPITAHVLHLGRRRSRRRLVPRRQGVRGDDTEAPFEASIPDAALRDELPEAGDGERAGAVHGRPPARVCST